MRVLIGVDGTDGSLEAVRLVARLFASDTDPVVLYYSPPSIAYHQAPAPDATTQSRLLSAMIDAVFERARAEFPENMKARVECVAGSQAARHGLLIAADEVRADLIVVGSHGIRPLDLLKLGSVSRALAHHATVPVLVVRSPVVRDPSASSHFRVLVACDRTEASRSAHDLLARFPWPAETEGDVVSVFEPIMGEVPQWLTDTLARETAGAKKDTFELFAADKMQAHEELNHWCADLPEPLRKHEPELLSGNASRMLLERLDERPYDLVVVGARRHGTIARWILGSTSDAVLNHAPCSVLIARQHEKA